MLYYLVGVIIFVRLDIVVLVVIKSNNWGSVEKLGLESGLYFITQEP